STILLAALLALVFVAPATASEADVKFSGEYCVAGASNSSPILYEDDATDSFMSMRLIVDTDFILSDDLKLSTEFTALDKIWENEVRDFNTDTAGENIQFNRAFMTIKTDIGLFRIGRQVGGAWGTSFADDDADADRLEYIVPIEMGNGKLYMAAVLEKDYENDANTNGRFSHKDNDKYFLSGTYVTDDYKCGLLLGNYQYNKFQDPSQRIAYNAFLSESTDPEAYFVGLSVDFANTYDPDLGAPAAVPTYGQAGSPADVFSSRGATTDADVWLISPYFTGKFGNFGLTFELLYITGTAEYPDAPTTSPDDRDVKAHTVLLEGTYEFDAWSFQLGVANQSGDANYTDDEISSIGYVVAGVDWEKMFILSGSGSAITGMTHGMNETLGGLGNHVGGGIGAVNTAQLDGFMMFYLGADYKATDDITVGLIAAMASADDVPDDVGTLKYEEDQGIEVDLTCDWQIMENLQLSAVAAYLSTGDYWTYRETGTKDNDKGEDNLTVFTSLTLTF
ncbi:MAG: hypothetical protein GY850_08495, partial [bacterium]|nr:hypothetical protein [bacterium]